MTLIVTTWNVENFTTASPGYAAKLAYLTTTLRVLDPDVIALQEILDTDALTELASSLGRHAIAATPDRRNNRVAFLLRSAPVEVHELSAWRLPPNTGAVLELDSKGEAIAIPRPPRPALQASIVHAGRRITFINVHLKSKQIRYPSADGGQRLVPHNEAERVNATHFALQRRLAEAHTVRAHAAELLQRGEHVVVLGDFNDVEDAATTRIFYGPEGNELLRLFNVALLATSPLRGSHVGGGGRLELIDHVLVSEGLRRLAVIEVGSTEERPAPSAPRVELARPDHASVTVRLAL
jgi:endonuclease/exonuclease/phosphatase family metal-dependent hydrolase